jgi:hypothetical protein
MLVSEEQHQIRSLAPTKPSGELNLGASPLQHQVGSSGKPLLAVGQYPALTLRDGCAIGGFRFGKRSSDASTPWAARAFVDHWFAA